MSTTSSISRREAVAILVGCFLTSQDVSATVSGNSVDGVSNWRRQLEAVFKHWESARRIGRAYSEKYPHDCNPKRWIGGFFGACPTSGKHDSKIYAQSIGQSIARSVQSDFANDNVVILDGWVLSRTEARLCAAVYML